jgi:YidC/Oxa1 family membrane protein insertase
MNFDRNTVIGFIILALLFFGFFYFNNKEQIAAQKAAELEQHRKDSIARSKQPKQDPALVKRDSLPATPAKPVLDSGEAFYQFSQGTEQETVIENDLVKISFTNKGGQPKSVELKKFKAPDSTNVKLAATDFDKIDYRINVSPSVSNPKTDTISAYYFSGGNVIKNADGSQKITYQMQSAGKTIQHEFVVRDGYMIDFTIGIDGTQQLFGSNGLNLLWQHKATQLQRDVSYEKTQSQICFFEDNDYDYYNIHSRTSKEFKDPVKWVAVKQQFFNTTLIAKNNFSSGSINWITPADKKDKTVVEASSSLKLSLPNTNKADIPLSIYYGPTDYKTLKKFGNDMENMVNLGSGIFSFVKYINRWIVIPVFDFFSRFTSNFGIAILLLTLFIRLLISPLTYSSYLSGAKMKVLRPEIEKLKAKYGNDQQQVSMEQMKLFREAGVNPLGGCIPALLQIPIFFALYSFFNSNVALRGQKFLWSDDLSQYDSIVNFSFHIPLYGDHVSLFTITAVLTSFLISIYSMSMTPDQSNPVLKYMPYIFPFVLLFIFNNLPSGLTWYYTVSNMITLALQFVIQTYIIDHDKILAKMEVNRKKPKTKSKWQERLDQMQEQQKQMKAQQNKNRR